MLDFSNIRGASAPRTGAQLANGTDGNRQDLPKAKVWLNFGYMIGVTVTDANGGTREEDRFVSLPVGIPLDTMEPININSRNREWAQFQAARNDLLKQLKDAASTLDAGQEVILACGDNGLAVQMRHVNGPAEVPPADDTNPFVAKLKLVG